jgi:hypothetical protein
MATSHRFILIEFFNYTPRRKDLQLTSIFDRSIFYITCQLFLSGAVFEEVETAYKYLTFSRWRRYILCYCGLLNRDVSQVPPRNCRESTRTLNLATAASFQIISKSEVTGIMIPFDSAL